MNITDIVTNDYEELSPETRVSKLASVFDDPAVKGVIVHGDVFEGVVTRRQLIASKHPPNEKLKSLVWHVPHLSPGEDVRKVARLMIESGSQILPVFDGQEMVGVVTVDGVLKKVQPFLDAATVAEAATTDLVTVDPGSSFGDVLHLFREEKIAHLPVVENDAAVGILSLYDVTDFTVRTVDQSQGGDASGTDAFGGNISDSAGSTRRGGFGAREGELARLLDLPIRDVMASPVRVIQPDDTLETAVEEMFAIDGSSLVVVDGDSPYGILTKTDVLDSLTWETGGNRAVQIYGIELVDDMGSDEIVTMVEKFDDRNHDMSVLDAKIHLHKHEEKHRGRALLLARIRLHTDRGLFIASGEGYGASHALHEARDILERQIRDEKTRGKSKKPRSEEFWEKRFGWLLEGED
ncbi:CBS domain-containing protein [Halovenus marina]|uniref:CBS domain-containing protein n=1 Tax=Halovenus marina TaxID=3396621 RepID=UPI003F57E035